MYIPSGPTILLSCIYLKEDLYVTFKGAFIVLWPGYTVFNHEEVTPISTLGDLLDTCESAEKGNLEDVSKL